MTANEALYWCEQFENNIVLADPQKEKMVLALQAMKRCKEALEKQIPKKAVKKNPICYSKTKDGQELYVYDCHCPMCDTKLKTNEHHCECGQALDWSDTD